MTAWRAPLNLRRLPAWISCFLFHGNLRAERGGDDNRRGRCDESDGKKPSDCAIVTNCKREKLNSRYAIGPAIGNAVAHRNPPRLLLKDPNRYYGAPWDARSIQENQILGGLRPSGQGGSVARGIAVALPEVPKGAHRRPYGNPGSRAPACFEFARC